MPALRPPSQGELEGSACVGTQRKTVDALKLCDRVMDGQLRPFHAALVTQKAQDYRAQSHTDENTVKYSLYKSPPKPKGSSSSSKD